MQKYFLSNRKEIVFQQVCANVLLNRLDNVYPVNLALHNTECEKTNPDLDFWKSQNVGGFSIDDKIRKNFEKLVKEKRQL